MEGRRLGWAAMALATALALASVLWVAWAQDPGPGPEGVPEAGAPSATPEEVEPAPRPPSAGQIDALIGQIRAKSGTELQDWPAAADRALAEVQQHAGKRKDVMLLFDVSGSMRGLHETDPWGLSFVGESYWSARRIVSEGLENGDLLFIGEFDNDYRLRRQMVYGTETFDPRELSVPVSEDVGTNMFYAHRMAIEDLGRLCRPDAWTCIIVFTDGYVDRPPDEMAEEVDRFRYYTSGPGIREYVKEAITFGRSYGVGAETSQGVIIPNLIPTKPPPAAENGAISGRVAMEDGTPVEGFEVSAVGPGGSPAQAQSDGKGLFSITSIGKGSYDLTATKSGYRRIKEPGIEVKPGLVTDVGTLAAGKPNILPWVIAVLVLLIVALVVGMIAKGMLSREEKMQFGEAEKAGRERKGPRHTLRDSAGNTEELTGARILYNVTLDPVSGTVRVGPGDYDVQLGGRSLPPMSEERLRGGTLVVRTRDGAELGRWTIG